MNIKVQYSFVGFDELTHFTERQFTYLLSRLRSGAESDSYAFGSCNPDADSWVLNWIEWYLDETGLPDPEKQGKIRYYIVIDEKPVFRNSAEEIIADFPDACKVWNPIDKEYITVQPKSFTFIAGTIFDNPILIKKNPKYLAELNSLPRVERSRLLEGNWYARAEGSNYWGRDWVENVTYPICKTSKCRAWDKGASIPSEKNRYVDPTASIRMEKDENGIYYIIADFIPSAKDEKSDIYGKFCRLAGERDALIKDQAEADGDEVPIILPKDVGQAGIVEFQESAKKLLSEGYIVKADAMPTNKSKLTKFSPFAAACQAGLVRIVEESFPNKATLDAFYKELESFDGERSTAHRKDDWPDACATAFNYLCKERVIKIVPRNQSTDPTLAKNVLDNMNN
jgi:predicted phage terminase large subunit-like protein